MQTYTGCPKKKCYLLCACGVVSLAAPGGLSCATMSPILRAASKCWHVKGLHVLNKCPLSVEIYQDLWSVSDLQKTLLLDER